MRGMILNKQKKWNTKLENQISTSKHHVCPEKHANQKSIHFPFLIVLLVLRDEPLRAPSVCNFLCCPHVSLYKHVILTEDFMLQGMFTTTCLGTDVFLSFHWYALWLATVEKQGSSLHYFLSRWHCPLLRTQDKVFPASPTSGALCQPRWSLQRKCWWEVRLWDFLGNKMLIIGGII